MITNTIVRRNSYDDSYSSLGSKFQTKDSLLLGTSVVDGNVAKHHTVDSSLYDDLYDFNDIPLDDGLDLNHPHVLRQTIGTDEDTDEGI